MSILFEVTDVMGSDLSVVNAARVSLGRRKTVMDETDERLIYYLARNGHTSPFRHATMTARVRCPIFVERQWFKHQVGCSANSISGRYVQFEETYWTPSTFRKGAANVKQGSSSDVLTDEQAIMAATSFQNACRVAFTEYQFLLSIGVCKEQARTVLPLATFTEFVFTASLEAWFHFWKLRSDSHAQEEIRVYAHEVDNVMSERFPVSWRALKGFNTVELITTENK